MWAPARTRIGAVGVAVGLLIAGCGGDDGGGQGAPATTPATLFACLEAGGYAEPPHELALYPGHVERDGDLGGVQLYLGTSRNVEVTFFEEPAQAAALVDRVASDDEQWEVVDERVTVKLFEHEWEQGPGERMLAGVRGCLEDGDAGQAPSADAGESDDATESSGETFSGTGYSITVSPEWEESSFTGADLVLVLPGDDSDLQTNVNVVVEDQPPEIGNLDELLDHNEALLERLADGAPRSLPGRDLDGEPTAGLVADAEQLGQRQTSYQRYALRAERIYTITLTVPRGDPNAEPLFDRILDGWRWR